MWRAAVVALELAACGRFGFAPTVDGAPHDLELAADATPCMPGALLCDDFETGNLTKWTTAVADPMSTAGVDSVRPHAGLRGLDAMVPPETSSGGIATACL